MAKIYRRFSVFLALGALFIGVAAYAEQAILVDEAVLVERDPDPESPAFYANYQTDDGWVVTSSSYVDAVVMIFDFGDVGSVSGATLSLPLERFYTQGKQVLLELVAFPDNGEINLTDYAASTLIPVAEFNPVVLANGDSSATLTFDVTGAVNANLPFSRYVGFRIKNKAVPSDVTDSFPGYNGVKFRPLYSLEYSVGGAPILPADRPRFDGYTLSLPGVSVPGLGVFNVQMNLEDPFNGVFALSEAADISPPGFVSGAGRTGTGLLSCDAFSAPQGSQTLTPGAPNLALATGVLDIPSVLYDGIEYSLQLQLVDGSNPLSFEVVALAEVDTASPSSAITISQFGGSLVTQPSQDFIPLCNGWVLIGNTAGNSLIERNVITGETGATYKFNTIPDEMLLDENNGIVYFTTHPAAERLYQLDLNSGSFTHHRLRENGIDFIPRDIALGENGNVFVLLYDAYFDPRNEAAADDEIKAEFGLWMGIFNSDGDPEVPAIPLILPERIEYDPVQKHIFLATESNLVTFEFNPVTQDIAFVPETDIPVGSGCTDFSISPDGNKLAYSCPQGNEMTPHTSIVDINPLDYYDIDGEWFLEGAPISATFDSTGEVLIATDNQKLYFFDTETHLLHSSYNMGLAAGESVNKIRVSRDGNFVLILMEADINATSGKIYWLPLPSFSPL